MGMKRVANDRAKYIPRSKVGPKVCHPEQRVEVSARRKFEAGPDGYFVWGRAKKH